MKVLLLTIGLVLIPGAVASAGGGGGGACRGFAEGATIVMRDSCFDGTGHAVPAGRTITAVNEGELPHTITAVDGSFDSGVVEPGQRFEFTLPGTAPVPYYCTLHGSRDGDGMAGVLLTAAPTTGDNAPLAASTTGSAPTGAWIVALLVATVGGVVVGRRGVRARTSEREVA